jgi:hypothetical protein
MIRRGGTGKLVGVPLFLLHHQHEAGECAAAFAAWAGFSSPLRHRQAAATCLTGGHSVWWRVQAENAGAALALLPRYVARRTVPIEIRDVEIP